MDVEPFLRADERRCEMRRRLRYPDDVVVVGKIARLFHLKGHEYLITAAAQVVRRCPFVRFLLVGDGSCAGHSSSRSPGGLTGYFQFLGLVGRRRSRR